VQALSAVLGFGAKLARMTDMRSVSPSPRRR
jgi:hypothetical protein